MVAFTVSICQGTSVSCGKLDNGLKGSWSRMKTEGAPVQRMLHSAIWTGDRMLIFGGYEPSPLGYTVKIWCVPMIRRQLMGGNSDAGKL